MYIYFIHLHSFFLFLYTRFKFDGIKHYKDVQAKNGIFPFGFGRQSIKYKLIKEMVPGKSQLFPFDTLTTIEQCTLHQAISNTIIKESLHDTSILCREIGQKLTGINAFYSHIHIHIYYKKYFRLK